MHPIYKKIETDRLYALVNTSPDEEVMVLVDRRDVDVKVCNKDTLKDEFILIEESKNAAV